MEKNQATSLLRGGPDGVAAFNAERDEYDPDELPSLRGCDFDGSQLQGANLGSLVLTEGRLQGAELSRANLMRAVCRGTNLQGATLRSADVREANLTGANLREADLQQGDFRYANLSDADLTGCNLCGADLRFSRGLSQAQLDGARGDATTQLPGAVTAPPSWS